MTINYTTLLGLTEPVTGTQSGTWGSDINTGLTDYVEAAIAGAQVISGSQTAVTLSVTTGSSSAPTTLSQAGSGATGSSQYQIIRCTGNPASTLVIDVPKQDKTYIVINATSTSQTVTLRGGPSTPTTGVNIVAGEKAVCAWNGSDFVKVGGAAGGTNTQVQFNDNGVFGGSANLTWDGSTLATTGLTASGAVTLSATTQNIALGTSQVGGTWTAGGASQTGAITLDQSTKTHTLNIGTGATENALTKTINLGTAGVSGSTTAINIGSAVSGATTNVTLNGTVQPGVVISGSSSGDALRITQTGSGNALLVEDAANPDSSPFVVDASGNVGIGTSSPSVKLHVSTSAAGIAEPVWLNNSQAVGAGVGSRLAFTGTTSNNGLAAIDGAFAGATTADGGYMVFNTRAVTSGVLTERMRLDTSGNLGLGVTPSAWNNSIKALQGVGGWGAFYTDAGYYGTTGIVKNAFWTSTSGTSWNYVNTQPALRYELGGSAGTGTHAWFTAPSGTANTAITSFNQVMTLDASGNLGVGTTSPSGSDWNVNSTVVQVKKNDTSGGLFKASSSSVDFIFSAGNGLAYIGTTTNTPITFYTNNGTSLGERARITSGGNLLVGTTTSKDQLTVNQGISMIGGGSGSTLNYSGYDLRTWASSYLSSSGSQTLVTMFSPQGASSGGGFARITVTYQYRGGAPGNNYAQYIVTTNTTATANLIISAGTYPTISVAIVGSGSSATQTVTVNYVGDSHVQAVVELFGVAASWSI